MARRSNQILTADLMKEIKRSATLWMKSNNHAPAAFRWQEGYGAFSVSYWDVEKIAQYIKNQKEHHKKMSWEDEYRKLLKKHGVEYDEKYLWD
jgi:REP element-mobilizing transposase RayT